MTPEKARKILSKGKWTGRELGNVLIACLVSKHSKGKLLIQPEELFKAVNTLDYDEAENYKVYVELFESISRIHAETQTSLAQFYYGHFKLISMLSELQKAEDMQKAIEYIPVTMTHEQYNRLKEAAAADIRQHKESYYSILFLVLKNAMTSDTAPKSIRDVIEETKKEPASAKSFSRYYNREKGRGYYYLPDGRRSDQMTLEEWQKILDDQIIAAAGGEPETPEKAKREVFRHRIITGQELLFKGAAAVREFVKKHTGKVLTGTAEDVEAAMTRIVSDRAKSTKNDAISDAIRDALNKSLNYTPPKWKFYDELPEGLTAYDLLGVIIDMASHAETDKKKHLTTFKKEYPALFRELNTYIEDNAPQAKGLRLGERFIDAAEFDRGVKDWIIREDVAPRTQDIRPNRLYKESVTRGDLKSSGILLQEDLLPTDKDIIDVWTKGMDAAEGYSKRERFKRGGISIIKNPPGYQIDAAGDYIEYKSLHKLFKNVYAAENNNNTIKDLYTYRELYVYAALVYLYAYNATIEIVSKVYKLPELATGLSANMEFFRTKVNAYNSLIYFFYGAGVYGSEAEKEKKRAIIKKLFIPIKIDELKPAESLIEGAAKKLSKAHGKDAMQAAKNIFRITMQFMSSIKEERKKNGE